MREKELFLPDFCHIRSVFALVMMGQLLAFVLVLAAPAADPWQSLSLLSLFVQWIVLSSAGSLCLLRRWLSRTSNAVAASASYLLILAITALMSQLAHRLLAEATSIELGQDFLLRALAIAAIVAAVVLRYLYVVHEWKRRLQNESAARIDALQARIRPHFLFNSLNTIASMIPAAPEKAEEAVEDLADLFRASLAKADRLVPLSEELALARRFLRMQELRLGERLRQAWEVEPLPADALIPPLTLQPLLENAVYHGIETRLEGGTVRIQGWCSGAMLMIRMSNPVDAGSGSRREGIGMAQDNIRERLRLAFGKGARLDIKRTDGEYQAELVLPYRSRVHENPDR